MKESKQNQTGEVGREVYFASTAQSLRKQRTWNAGLHGSGWLPALMFYVEKTIYIFIVLQENIILFSFSDVN